MAATLTAALRNTAGDWVFVTTSGGESGWTPVEGLVAYGLEQLPALEIDAAAASTGASRPPQRPQPQTELPTARRQRHDGRRHEAGTGGQRGR